MFVARSKFVACASLIVSLLVARCPCTAHADQAEESWRTRSRAFHADAEVDPTAYVLHGYSVHAGLGYRRWRMDLGAFALEQPELLGAPAGFETNFNGWGVKLQYFVFGEQAGGFVGIDTALVHLLAQQEHTQLAVREQQWSVGVNLGWRFMLYRGLYVTPWLGVSYTFDAHDLSVGGQQYDVKPYTIFPAVHIGYRFL